MKWSYEVNALVNVDEWRGGRLLKNMSTKVEASQPAHDDHYTSAVNTPVMQ